MFEARFKPESQIYRVSQLRDISGAAKYTWLNESQLIIFIECLFNSIVSTVIGEKRIFRCEKILYAIAKTARKILTNLSPNPARPRKVSPTYNSGLSLRSISSILAWCCNALTPCMQQCFHGKNRPITYRESEWGHRKHFVICLM